MSNICEKLDENIERHLDAMSKYGIGSTEMSSAINEVVRLHKLRMDELKHEVELDEQFKRNVLDTQKYTSDELRRDDELCERKRDRYFRVGIAAAELVLPLALYGVLSYIGFAREFDGVVTSDTLKRVLNSIKIKR